MGSVSWLSDEMTKFPEEFLLFSDKIGSLEFEDRVQNHSVTWTANRDENRVSLDNGVSNSDWLIFRHKHEVSTQAAVEAGSIVARQHVDVTWAVPLTGNQRRKMGRFWKDFASRHR
jgi:hypothetical protein